MAFQLVDELAAVGVDKTVAEEIAKNPKAAAALQEKFEGSLRQSDYDRKMNSGKAELDAARRTLEEERTTFEEAKQRINEQYLSGIASREQAETLMASARAKLKSQEAIYGIALEKEVFGEGAPVTPPAQRREETLPSEFDKRVGALEDLFRTNVNFQVEMQDIVRMHMELFPDKPLLMKELIDDAVKQRRSPTQVWDDKFGATAKRTEIMADKYRAEGAAKAKEELEKKYSGQSVNGFRSDVPLSPVFQTAANGNKQLSAPKDRSANAAASVAAAVEAFRGGKYRNAGRMPTEH